MKVKYLIYFFTFSLTSSFAIFICNELTEARTQYNESALNLYKIQRAEEISAAFQHSLQSHRLKRLSLLSNSIDDSLWQESDSKAREKIEKIRPFIDSKKSQQLGAQQKFAIQSMLILLEKLLDNDTRQLMQRPNDPSNLFNINSAYYITQASKDYYRYTYEARMLNADSFLFLEAIRLNNQLNISLTELIDQIIDVNINSLDRKNAYLKAIQLTGVLNALSSRLTFMKIAYEDAKTTSIINQLLQHVSRKETDRIASELYESTTHNSAFDADFIYQYVKTISELSQQLYQRSFNLEMIASRNEMYRSQAAIDGMISLGVLITLFFLLPSLIFCSNISRWLTKTQNNIQRLSQGDMAIDTNEVFYSQELIAIGNAINQLKLYHMEKIRLENEKFSLIKELETSSYLDPLTNIYNRRKFFRQCAALDDSSYPLAFCLIDIDNFKVLNDTYGHDVGDRALVAFGELLRGAFRSNDIFCRYGGEEFAVILGHCTLQHARAVMEKLRQQTHLLQLPLAEGGSVSFTISCGIAEVSHFKQLQTAIKKADEALYFCKKNGKDSIATHPDIHFL
ncbi:GGDEF domain-containing protein [Serratia sp. NPDC078593]|uniref:GGDEF domain-containing protein n=1 Tax=unclassified Serratia (in: enterobacteria) TaxID=2647522 RepID=UPI0037D428AC